MVCKIGSLRIEGELFLAPLADYTNVAFRTLACENGAALCYTELISAKALTMKSKKTEEMLRVSQKEKPVFLQLFGNNPLDFERAVQVVEKKFPENFAGYDLNCGCSVPKAIKGKYGSFTMQDPQNVGLCVAAMKNYCKKPVTIKMRVGYKKENYLEVAEYAINAGADAVCLHPRLGTDGFSSAAKWEKITELKKAFGKKVPIIGNGDIKVPQDALRMKIETKCDFEMIGRACIGNAFFFQQANALLRGKKIPERDSNNAQAEAKRFLDLAKEFSLKPNDVRPYLIGWAKGFTGAAQLRNAFGLSKTIEEMEKILIQNALQSKNLNS